MDTTTNKMGVKVAPLESSVKKANNKATIPRALREQVWLQTMGSVFEAKCYIRWCRNRITAFDFHVGHNIPEARGGTLQLENLRPLCARCNTSMSSSYSIDEWQKLGKEPRQNCCLPWF